MSYSTFPTLRDWTFLDVKNDYFKKSKMNVHDIFVGVGRQGTYD